MYSLLSSFFQHICESLLGLQFRVSPNAFFQGNIMWYNDAYQGISMKKDDLLIFEQENDYTGNGCKTLPVYTLHLT